MIISITLGAISILTNLCGVFQPLSLLFLRNLPMPTTGPSPANPFGNIALAPAVSAAFISLLNLALGAYLLYAGILIHLRKPSAYRHHWRYALLKCPVAIIGALANGWMQYEIQTAVFTASRQPNMPIFPVWIALISSALGLLFALAYPVALLIALSRPTIRTQFADL